MAFTEQVIIGDAIKQVPLLGLDELNPMNNLDQGDRKSIALSPIRGYQEGVYVEKGKVPTSYNRILGDNYHPEFTDRGIQKQLAAEQSAGGQFINFLNQGIVGEVVGGTAEGVGYLSNLLVGANLANDAEKTFGNILVKTGKALRTWTEDVSPVYRDPDANKFDPSSWSWWMQNGKSVFSTLSLMIPAYGTVKAGAAVGKLLGVAGKLGVTAETALSVLGQAGVSRYMENMMEANSAYEEVYKTAIKQGMSESDANKKASIAASKTYSADWAMLGMDIAQYALLHGKLYKPTGATTPGLGKLLGYDTGKIAAAEAKRYGFEILGEGFEEGYQWMATEEGKYAAEKAFNPSLKGNFNDRVGGYLADGEMWTNAFFGAIGGGVMTAAYGAIERAGGDHQVNEVKSWGIGFRAAYEKMKIGKSMGDEHMVTEAQSELKSMLGVRGASKQMLDQTIDFYDKVANGNFTAEELQTLNIDPETVTDLKGTDIEQSKADIRDAGMKYVETLKQTFQNDTQLNKGLKKAYENRPKDMANISLENYGRSYASLIARSEFQLEKLNEIRQTVEEQLREAESRIVNWEKLSSNKQSQFQTKSYISALKKQKKYIESSLENKNIDENYKKDIDNQLNAVDSLLELQEQALARTVKNYTKEEKESDKLVDIESPAVDEFYDRESILTRINSSIAGYQSSIKRYKAGEISSKEAKEEYDSKLEEEEEDTLDTTLEENDIVGWNDDQGQPHYGVVESIDEKDPDVINVQELDEAYKNIGKPIPKNKVDVELVEKIRDLEIDRIEVETISSDDVTADDNYKDELENSGLNKALSDLANSLSTSNIDVTRPSKVDVRDLALDSYSSNPVNKFDGAVATFTVDWANKFWDEGGKERRQFKLKAQAGKITIKDIQSLLAVDPKNADNYSVELVDKLPISVSIKVGDETFKNGLYLHDSDFWNVRMPDGVDMDPDVFEAEKREETRSTRIQILTELLKGNVVTTKDIKKLNGWFNVVKTKGNIHERLGVESGSLTLYVGVEGPLGFNMIQSSSTDIQMFGKPRPGGLYILTNKTASGNTAMLKVDPAKLSTEHAEILWEAMMVRYPGKGGAKAKLKDDRVSDKLTVQEIMNILVLWGDKNTNLEHLSNRGKGKHLKNKQLFVRSGRMLFFGDQSIDMYETRPAEVEANKLAFIEWATKNKNYRVPIAYKNMALDLNKVYKKKFKLGSIVNNADKPYSAVLMDTAIGHDANGPIYLIATNVDRVKDVATGGYIESITHSPVIDINTRSLISTNPKVIVKEEKPAPAKPKVVVEIPTFITESTMPSIEQLKLIEPDTNLYYVNKAGEKVVFATIRVNESGTKYQELQNGFDESPNLHNLKSLRLVKMNQEGLHIIYKYMLTGGIKEILFEKGPGFVKPQVKPVEPSPSPDIDTGDESLDDIGTVGKESYKVKTGTKLISDQEIEWLNKKLGPQNVEKTKKLIKLAGQKGRFYFGVFRADAILIYEAAPADVLYHEAFHRVSLGYLSEFDRNRVYNEARRRYGLPEASNEAIEEVLADQFMEYKSTRKAPGKRTFMDYIVELYDFIVSYFTGRTRLRGDDIDKLFDLIERGRFRLNDIKADNLKALKGRSVGYEIGGMDVPTINNIKEMDDLVIGLTTVLINVNHIDNLNDIKNLDFRKLLRYIDNVPSDDNPYKEFGLLQRFRSVKRKADSKLTDKSLSKEDREKVQIEADEASHLISLYESVINPEYLPVFAERINTALRSYNIVKKEIDVEDVENENYVSTYNDAKYEFSTKDSVLASIKFLIATLPASDEINRLTRTINHVNFNKVWSQLLFDLHHKDTIEEILDVLDSKSDIYYYKKLAEKLRAGDDILRIQFKVAMNKHKHLFVNFLFNQSFDPDSKRDTFTFKMNASDIFSAARIERMAWNEALYSLNVIDKTGVPKIDGSVVDSILKEYGGLLANFSLAYNLGGKTLTDEKFEKYVEAIIPLFNKIGIDVDRETVTYVVDQLATENKITRSEALNLFLLDKAKYIFQRLKDEISNPTLSVRKLYMATKGDEKILRVLSEAKYEVHPDILNDSILGPAGNQYFTYSQNTYMSDVIRKFSKDETSVISKLNKIYNKRSAFLQQMLDNDVRKNVKLLTLSSFIQEDIGDSGRDYLSINRIEDYLIKMYAFEKGLIALPTLADKRSYYFIKGLQPIDFDLSFNDKGEAIIPDNIIDLFLGYAEDEKERIEYNKKIIDDYNNEKDPILKKEKADKLYDNYHGVRRGNEPIDTTVANSQKYHLFPSFNRKGFVFAETARDEIRDVLLQRLKEELEFASNRGIITGRKLEDGTFVPDYNVKLDENLVVKNKEDFGTDTKALTNIFAKHMIRGMQSSIEFSKLFAGDPAFKALNKDKKTIDDDYVKRLTGALSTGDVTNNESIEYGVLGKNYTVSTMYTQIINLEKIYTENVYNAIFDAQLADAVKEYSKKPGYEDLPNKTTGEQIRILKDKFNINIKEMLSGFKQIDSTDGQAWISPDMYRTLSISIGDWSPTKETAFNLLQSDRELTKAEYAQSLNVVLQPLKVVSYGLMEDGDLDVPLFDKMSMATIFRQMTKFGHKDTRTEIMNLLDRMEAKGAYKGMTPINMIKMSTVSKTGGKGAFNFYSDKDLTQVSDFSNIPVFEQPFSLSRRQLVTDPHDQARTKSGTQMIKMGMADIIKGEEIYDNPLITEMAEKSKITGDELINTILRSTGALSAKGLDRLKSRLGYKDGKLDKEKLVKLLKRDSIKAATADLIVDSFKMDANGEMYLELDSFPNRKHIFSRIVSMFAKEIIDMKLPGNQFIQMSNMGIRTVKSNELKWTTINKGKVISMECYVSINLFKHVIPNYDNLSFDQKREFILRNADSIMGYRIPTQGQNSVFIMRVKDVYPEAVGDVITLPAPFTKLTGSDFDIDKVYLIRYNYKIIDNQLHKVQFHNTVEDVWDKELKIKYHWVYKYLENLDTIAENDIIAIETADKAIRYLENLKKIIDSDIMDTETLDYLLESLKVNLLNYNFDIPTYETLKSAIGESIEENKNKFFDKYKDEQDPYKFNGRAAVENLLIDSYMSVYSNLAHVRQTTTPLGASVGAIKDLAIDIHQYDESTRISNDLVLHTPSRQSDIKFEYTSGKDGVGPFALNNVHHILAQVAGIKFSSMTSYGLLNEDVTGNIDLSQINGKDNLSIMSWLSALIDIHVDVAKDPFVAWLNLNDSTYDVTALLIRGGLGLDTFRFISQPIIKEFAELYLDSTTDSKISRFRDREDVVKYLKNKWGDKVKDSTPGTGELTQKELFSSEEMMNNIMVQKDKSNDPAFVNKQLQYFESFLQLSRAGKMLNELVQASQLDTKKFGNSVTSVISFKNKIDKLIKDGNFIGLNKLFATETENETSFLGPYYDNFLTFTLDVLSGLSISSTPVFNKMLSNIIKKTKIEYAGDKKLIDIVSDELMGVLFAKFFHDEDFVGMDPTKLPAVIKYITETLSTIKYAKNPVYKDLRENNPIIELLNNAPLDIEGESFPFETFLITPNKNLADKFSTDALIYGWRDLFEHPDKKIQNLARLLLYYSFFTSGFRNRLFSFHNYIPPSKMKNLDVVGSTDPMSFNEFIKVQRDLLGDELNYLMFASLEDEVIINNWSNSRIVPRIGRFDRVAMTKYIGDVEQATPTAIITKKWNNKLGENKLQQPIFTKYLTTSIKSGNYYKTYLLKYIGYTTQVKNDIPTHQAVYKVIPKKSYEKGGLVVKEYLFDKSVFDSNNVVSIPDGEEFNTLTSVKVVEQSSMFSTFQPVTDLEVVDRKLDSQIDVFTGGFAEIESGEAKVEIVTNPWGYQERVGGVSTLRGKGIENYGNPFSHLRQDQSGYPIITMPSIEDAVQAYEDWIKGVKYQDVEPERRQWIVNQIISGALDGKVLLYFRAGYRSHADALADIVNSRVKNIDGRFGVDEDYEFTSDEPIAKKTTTQSPQSVIEEISKSTSVEDVEKILMGYKGAIGSKRHDGRIWVKAMYEFTFDYNKIANDLADEINAVYPGLINIRHDLAASSRANRGVFEVVVNEYAWNKYLSPEGKTQGTLFKMHVGRELADLQIEDSRKIVSFINKNKDVTNAYDLINNIEEYFENLSNEHKDLIKLINSVKGNFSPLTFNVTWASKLKKNFPKGDNKYEKTLAFYQNGGVYIVKDNIKGEGISMLIGTILHETIHHFTLSVANKYKNGRVLTESETAFIDSVSRLFNLAKSKTRYSDHNAYKSVSEFLSDGITDQTIIDELKAMKDDKSELSLWQRFKQFILKLFGVDYHQDSYHYKLLSMITDFVYHKQTVTSGAENIQARKIKDNIYINYDNPTHADIVETLEKFEDMYDKLPSKFPGVTTIMNQLKLGGLPFEMISEEDQEELNKFIQPGTETHFQIERSFKKAIKDIEHKYNLSPRAAEILATYFSKFKKPGVTILSEVKLAHMNIGTQMSGIVDLVIIDGNNKVHLFDFKTKIGGFETFDEDFHPKKGQPKYHRFSSYKKVGVQLTAYANMWKEVTNTEAETMTVIPLKPIVDEKTKTIISYELDKSFNGKDVISIPRSPWVSLLYSSKGVTMDKTQNQDVVSTSEQQQVLQENAALWHAKFEKIQQMKPEQELLIKIVKSLEHSIEVSRKRYGPRKFQQQATWLNNILEEEDTNKALSYAIDIAYKITKKAYDELNALKKSGDIITLGMLYRFKDSVSAFDIIEEYEKLLVIKHGLYEPKIIPVEKRKKTSYTDFDLLRSRLNGAIQYKNAMKSDYERIGLELMVDYIYPFYTKVKAEYRYEYGREYEKLKFENKLPNKELTKKEYVDTKLDENSNAIDEKSKLMIRKELKKAARDITVLEAWIDNLPDSPDAVTGALVKAFVMYDDTARIEIENTRLKALPIVREFTDYTKKFGLNYQKAYDFMEERDLKTGELNGHYVSRIHSSLMHEYRSVAQISSALTVEGEENLFLKTWRELNMPLNKPMFRGAYVAYVEQLLKEEKITEEERTKLVHEITKRSGKPVTYQEMVEGDYITENTADLMIIWRQKNTWNYVEPAPQWHNPQWDALQKILDNPEDPRSKMYNMITQMQERADDMVPTGIKLGTRLPGVIKQKNERLASGQNLYELTKSSLSKSLDFKVDDTHRVHTELLDLEGNARYFVPVHYTGMVTKTIIDENGREIEVFDPDEQSFDLANIYYHYLSSAIDFQWKNNILPEMEMHRYLLNNRDVVKKDSFNEIKYRASRFFGGEKTELDEVTIKGGNIAKQFDTWLLYALYGQAEKDMGVIPGTNIDAGKLLGNIQRYTALNLLGLNVVAGVANLGLGEIMQAIEAFAGQHIGLKEYHKAQMFYMKNLPGIMGDISSREPKNIVSLLLREFNVLHDPKIKNLTDTAFKDSITLNEAFFTNHVGEHKMQGTFMLAMLEKERAYNSKGEDIGSILDNYIVKDGILTLKDEVDVDKTKFHNMDRRRLEYRIRGVLTSLHGEYSDLGRVAIQQHAITAMAYMFRKFVVPGFRRRWGSRRYNERIEEFTEGNYVTTIKFARGLIKNLRTYKALMLSKEWAMLDDMEKANIYRSISEVVALIAVIILAHVAVKFSDDDDKEGDLMWNNLAYQALRLKSELLFFLSPTEAMKILRSPAASISVLDNTIKLFTQVTGPGWEDYEQGPWKDHMKIEKTLIDMTIGVRQYYRVRDIGEIVDLWKI